jgi:hypothetical protein
MCGVEFETGDIQSTLSGIIGEDVVNVTLLHDGLNLSLGIDTVGKKTLTSSGGRTSSETPMAFLIFIRNTAS